MTQSILANLRPAKNSRKKVKRIGRGQGSGHGGTATKGHKGAKARSGHKFKIWFEGGQMPLTRRVPKHGFTSPHRVEAQVVNVGQIATLIERKRISGSVTPASLYEAGAIRKKHMPVKILADGNLTTKVDVTAHAVSKAARTKIEAAGGTVTVLAAAPAPANA